MARRGRKRNNVDREPNGRAQREGKRDSGTPEFLKHRARLVDAKHIADPRAGDLLGIMELAGVITASQRQSGWAWATAMWATYGRPHAAIVNLDGGDKGHSDGPSERMEKRARAGLAALEKVGHDATHWARAVCLEQKVPGWYWRRKSSVVRLRDERDKRAFVEGLAALEGVLSG